MNALDTVRICSEGLNLDAGPENLDEMFMEYLEALKTDPEAAVCPPPEVPCKVGHYMGWFGLNAFAYGFRKGKEAAEV